MRWGFLAPALADCPSVSPPQLPPHNLYLPEGLIDHFEVRCHKSEMCRRDLDGESLHARTPNPHSKVFICSGEAQSTAVGYLTVQRCF